MLVARKCVHNAKLYLSIKYIILVKGHILLEFLCGYIKLYLCL